jgi:16S rRNA (adenine1518-N6/adenine1519-N6)-dimethyltransferase
MTRLYLYLEKRSYEEMGNTTEIIKKFKIKLNKNLGQNFLTDENIVKKIVGSAIISDRDLVIEIGPGIGSMTRELCKNAGKVLAVEIDKYLIPALTYNLREFNNIEIVNKDIMDENIVEMINTAKLSGFNPENVKVIANLPYYITTPIIMKFLEEAPGIDMMVFMVQKEVAERMVAKPGGKDYGALSVAVQFYSEPSIIFNVSPDSFVPRPNVDSTVIKLNVYKEPIVDIKSKKMFFKTVKAAFGQRRKTLPNALCNSGYFKQNKEEMKDILENIGVGENQRGETLSIMQFAELSNSFYEKN